MRFESSLVKFYTELYTCSVVSLRELSRIIKRWRNIEVSHQAIANWINKSSDFLRSLSNIEASETWHVDETAVKVKGES